MIRSCLFIARRHLLGRRRQSLLTITGLAIGVMVLITAISMMDGLKVSFIAQMLQVSPHVTLKPEALLPPARNLVPAGPVLIHIRMPDAPDEDTELTNYRALQRTLDRLPELETAAPEFLAEGFVTFGALRQSAQIQGVDPAKQKHIGNLADRITAGSYQDFEAQTDGMLMGYQLARALTVAPGDRVQAVARAGKIMSFRVSGILKTGMTSFDRSHVLVHLERAQRLQAAPSDRATSIAIRAHDPAEVARAAALIQRATGHEAETWQQENRNTLSMYTMIGSISYILVIFTMLVAGLGVSNVLTTVVLEKRLDVAILLSMGYPRPAISLIFVIEGVILGTAGSVLGCGLGLITSTLMGLVPMDFGDTGVMSITHLYMNQSPWYYLLAAAFGFAVSLLAGAFPARRAARLDPVEIIRTEV